MTPQAASQFMKIVGVISIGTALIIAAGAAPPMDRASVLLHDFLDWPLDGATGAFSKETRLLSAITGGVFASLGMIFILIVAPAIKRGDEAIRRAAIISVLTWFVIDSAGSIAAGVPSNAVFNCGFLALFLAPLLAVSNRGAAQAGAH